MLATRFLCLWLQIMKISQTFNANPGTKRHLDINQRIVICRIHTTSCLSFHFESFANNPIKLSDLSYSFIMKDKIEIFCHLINSSSYILKGVYSFVMSKYMSIIPRHTMPNWQPQDPNSEVLILNNVLHQHQQTISAYIKIYFKIDQHQSFFVQ